MKDQIDKNRGNTVPADIMAEQRAYLDKGTDRLITATKVSDIFSADAMEYHILLHKTYQWHKLSIENIHKLCKHSTADWRDCDNVACQTNLAIITEVEVKLFGEVQ